MLTKIDIALLPSRLLVSHYLLASYCYYWLYRSPMTDDAFDMLCVRLDKEWEKIDHQHKALVERGALSAGTCLLPVDDYPTIVKSGAHGYLHGCLNGDISKVLHREFGGQPAPLPRARRTRPATKVEPPPAPTPRVRRTRPRG